MVHNVTRSLILMTILATLPDAAQAAGYTFTTIDVPGASLTYAYDINNVGQIVGFYDDDSGDHGFLRDPTGRVTTIDGPEAIFTAATGINDAGQAVGLFHGADLVIHAFLRDTAGVLTTLNIPGVAGGIGSPAVGRVGINDLGQIVGTVASQQGLLQPFLYTAGVVTIVDVGPVDGASAYGINTVGHIVGSLTRVPGEQGFVNTAGGTLTFAVPGAGFTEAFGINDVGETVGLWGVYDEALGYVTIHGFLRDAAGAFTTIDVPGAIPIGINDAGQIVGIFFDDSGLAHGFLATPTPEPSTWLLFGSGVVGLAALRFRPRGRHP